MLEIALKLFNYMKVKYALFAVVPLGQVTWLYLKQCSW